MFSFSRWWQEVPGVIPPPPERNKEMLFNYIRYKNVSVTLCRRRRVWWVLTTRDRGRASCVCVYIIIIIIIILEPTAFWVGWLSDRILFIAMQRPFKINQYWLIFLNISAQNIHEHSLHKYQLQEEAQCLVMLRSFSHMKPTGPWTVLQSSISRQ